MDVQRNISRSQMLEMMVVAFHVGMAAAVGFYLMVVLWDHVFPDVIGGLFR